jgi:hypothetical protein
LPRTWIAAVVVNAIPFARQSEAQDNAAYTRILTRDRDYATILYLVMAAGMLLGVAGVAFIGKR